ncbi:MAG: type I DNA topoisomerase [Candidatus Yanofskybacteria bacterium]|nr:type I DNA topoisomerase [Candidatus Yanofskybacteria bacterium]
MGINLIIVESPTKAKTIGRFLGSGFLVRSSFGHVRDLPKSTLGVDVEHGFKPKYIIPAKAKPVIAELKEAAKKSDSVILATDEDREGEAIAWHLAEALGLGEIKNQKSKIKNVERIVFHEITKSAIENAIENPRTIDYNLVDAQQARRVLDRLVGYELSPFLWKKIRPGLSAGRVQSVALRIVVEREREIEKFKAQEYWSIEAGLNKKDGTNKFQARLVKIGEQTLGKLDIKNQTEAEKIASELNGAEYKVADINSKETVRNPSPPFTTSTLQQEASRKFGMSAKQTMMIAQQLYETGYITYMRTDSLNLAESALQQAQKVITENFGKEYSLGEPRRYTTKSKGAQEAHEAIRPTDLTQKPEMLKGGVDARQFKLYDIIWKRTVASQMQQAVFDQTAIDILATRNQKLETSFLFRANGQIVKFDGFIRAYTEGRDEKDEEEIEGRLPELEVNEPLNLIELFKLQHFTEPPPRYSDATLIKALEAHGIGRPSTYAPTLATIQDRDYVEKIDRRYFKPTEVGFLVNDMLVENFPEIVDINFTSHIEEELDDIAEGKIKWVPVIEEFYTPFKKNLEEKVKSVEKLVETSDIPCPHCGKMMIIKFGRLGKFMACPEPGSKITQPMPEEAAKIKELEEKTRGEKCPLCGKLMDVKRGRFGYFLGCTDYPKCKGIAKILNKTGFKCPNCSIGDLVERKSRGRGRIFYGCSRFPECNFLTGTKPGNQEELAKLYEEWKANPPSPRRSKTKADKNKNQKSIEKQREVEYN